jgi:hypothetical protein
MPPLLHGVVRQTEGGKKVVTLRQRLGARDRKLILMGSDNLLAGVWAPISWKYSLFGVQHSSRKPCDRI